MPRLEKVAFSGPLASILQRKADTVELYWLGQAGFLLRSPMVTLLIDPIFLTS
jgi:hypothetical protein